MVVQHIVLLFFFSSFSSLLLFPLFPTKVPLFLSHWLRYFYVCLKRVGKVEKNYPGEKGESVEMNEKINITMLFFVLLCR